MKIHELTVTSGRARKRVGRGISAGGGKTAGRGTKGQKARTGKKIKPGFEGGQTKLAMRLPKARGFTSRSQRTYQIVNVSDLHTLAAKTVDVAALMKAGLIKKADEPIKLLGDGKLESAVKVAVQAVSASARAAVEKAGGSVELVATPDRARKPQAPKKETK